MFSKDSILQTLRSSATKLASFLVAVSLTACDGKISEARGSLVVDQSTCLVAEKTLIEIGEVGMSDIASVSTAITNSGKSDVKITSLETDCTCVTATVDKEALRPNEDGRIRIEFDANGSSDKQFHLVTINGDNGQTIKICVTANVVTPQ